MLRRKNKGNHVLDVSWLYVIIHLLMKQRLFLDFLSCFLYLSRKKAL